MRRSGAAPPARFAKRGRKVQDTFSATACEVFVSGPKVQIDAATAFEPDVVVSCAAVPDGLLVPEPLIVVEVLSPSTRDKDLTVKLAGYAAMPSVAHYLLVDTRRRLVVHHHRSPGEQEFRTSIARSARSVSTRGGWISTSMRSTPEAVRDDPFADHWRRRRAARVLNRRRDRCLLLAANGDA